MTEICRFCGSWEAIKQGQRKTQHRGKIQRYSCKSCGRRFVRKDAFFRMRNDPQKITMCLDLYFRGVSLRKIQEHLQAFQPHNSSHQTILNWIRRYCTLISKFVDKLDVKMSEEISIDEMEFKTKGEKSWFIDVLDMETRYMLSSGYYYNRSMRELKEVLRRAKSKSESKPTAVYTDGLRSYPKLLDIIYKGTKHYSTMSCSKVFNWKIERLHGNVRERTKVMRQFNSLESAKAIMKGYEIFHNFCRKHQGIGCYPYELATDLKLGKNKWLELINLAENR